APPKLKPGSLKVALRLTGLPSLPERSAPGWIVGGASVTSSLSLPLAPPSETDTITVYGPLPLYWCVPVTVPVVGTPELPGVTVSGNLAGSARRLRAAPPTDPDVANSGIRLVSPRLCEPLCYPLAFRGQVSEVRSPRPVSP